MAAAAAAAGEASACLELEKWIVDWWGQEVSLLKSPLFLFFFFSYDVDHNKGTFSWIPNMLLATDESQQSFKTTQMDVKL